jgi:hypothetical protein
MPDVYHAPVTPCVVGRVLDSVLSKALGTGRVLDSVSSKALGTVSVAEYWTQY